MEGRASDVFVGRAHELAELERALAAARAGRGATVLVVGEAGIGKTRLAAEVARRALAEGFEVLLGRAIDVIGTELPFQLFVDALRPLSDPWRLEEGPGASQLRAFQAVRELLAERAATAPLLLELEDLHWADASSLDLTVFLARGLADRPVLVLGTARGDEPASAGRVRRLAEGIRRSGATVLELGPLDRDELAALLAARAHGPVPAALATAIATRSEGNPFLAEELLAASGDPSGELPRGLRELLLQRAARLDRRSQALLRVAAAAGREVPYPLLCAVSGLPERDVRESLRRAVEGGVLVADRASGSVRFRHALFAEAIDTTILPGEREELHARLAEELTAAGAAAAELAPHWAAAGRGGEALSASVEAAREAEAVFGLAEAHAHLERALSLWDAPPDASRLAGLSLDELCAWTAELASRTGDAPRAAALIRRAIDLVGEGDPGRTALLHMRLGRYLFESGAGDTFLAAYERALELVPGEPPSAERARALAAVAHGLHLLWRHEESLALCEEALALARTVGAREPELRALSTLGSDLAYLGRGEEGLARLGEALELARAMADPLAVHGVYVGITDALTMLGRPSASARVGLEGLQAIRPYGAEHTVLAANRIEALLATGEWDAADRESAEALRAITANYPHMPLILRADLELGRGDFDAARGHLEAARATIRHEPGLAYHDGYLAELALWERRWAHADDAVRDGVAHAAPRWGAQIRVWLCAKGLRAHAELAALARARRDAVGLEGWLARADRLLAVARLAAAEAAGVTPNAGGWLALAEAEAERARGIARPEAWSEAAAAWDRLERPPLAAYCRWRESEALVAAGASRLEASGPLRAAHAVASRIRAAPLAHELELLARRARLDLGPSQADRGSGAPGLQAALGLTAREAEVLALVARGYTNREIAATLVISARTAGVHVSHILRKLRAPNRTEAAAIAHRLAEPDAPSHDAAR
jgi:DNA-binding CsgD family transcriptional regulator/tetratricopeptide (TPR) repeat protein